MKRWLVKGILVVVTLVLALSGMTWAIDNDGCSNATLTGDYGFTVVAQTLNANGTTSVSTVVGMKHFDGAGNLTQVDFGVTDGVPQPGEVDPITGAFHFRTGETGTYHVNPDCTGSMEIDFNAVCPPGVSTGVIQIMFVLSNHGRAIHEVVAHFNPPCAPVAALNTTHAEDYKLGSDSDHD